MRPPPRPLRPVRLLRPRPPVGRVEAKGLGPPPRAEPQYRGWGGGNTLPVGRSTTGSIRGLPFIVDRADRLRDFYIAEGAVYEGEDATVLPPPAPISPGVPTNIEVSRVENRLLLTWDPPGDRGEADSYYLWLVWRTPRAPARSSRTSKPSTESPCSKSRPWPASTDPA